jgi:hypothetical protein
VFDREYELSEGSLLSAQWEKVLSVMIGGDPGEDGVREKSDSKGGLDDSFSCPSGGSSLKTGSVCTEFVLTIPWRAPLPFSFADARVIELSLPALALSLARLCISN